MPPKAKPDTAAYQKLKKDIKEGTIGTLYVFHGEEAYLRDFYLGQLKRSSCPPEWRSSTSTPSVERSLTSKPWPSWWTACP